MQVLRFYCSYAGGTFSYSYVGGSRCYSHAGDCFCCNYVDRSFCSTFASGSFCSEYVGDDNFYCIYYAGESLCYNYVSLYILQKTFCPKYALIFQIFPEFGNFCHFLRFSLNFLPNVVRMGSFISFPKELEPIAIFSEQKVSFG